VAAVCCQADFDYWQAFADRWDDQELVLVGVEHDMDASDKHIAALLACPEPLCSWAYCVHWASTGLPYDVIAAGMGARDPETNPDPEHLQGGEEWAAWSAIGLCKIAPEARIAPLRREPWQRLELAVHDAVKRPWHMHGPPVDHWHW
jgi:hypothetical protein